jgi:acetyl-CoA C-acetyltransferase
MSIKGKAYIAGVYEHPGRNLPDKSLAQIHAELCKGALEDAGLTKADVDGFFCAGDTPGLGAISIADYMGLDLKYTDTTETPKKWRWAPACAWVRRMRPRPVSRTSTGPTPPTCTAWPPCATCMNTAPPANSWPGSRWPPRTMPSGTSMPCCATSSRSRMCSTRRSSPTRCTVWTAASSPMAAALMVIVSPEIAKSLKRPSVKVHGPWRSTQAHQRRRVDLTYTGARWSGAARLRRGRRHAARHQVRLHLRQLHHHRARCSLKTSASAKGQGGKFVSDGNLISGVGKLPFNTDGGGLCNNHPANRGGITKVIEAVRQLRGEAHPKVQVKNCDIAPWPMGTWRNNNERDEI